MLHLISSIQTRMYLAHCYASNDMQYAEVVPSEAEKHTSPYIFYGIPPNTKNSKCELPCTSVNPFAIALCPPTHKHVIIAHSKPTRTFCGLLNVNGY